jgi:tripartite-type tricarboxylate transporter receptor subunit TctC
MKKTMIAAIAAGLLCGAAFYAAAQNFPAKPIRLLIPASPGGGTDAIARVLAESLSGSLKQPVIAENKPGASGIIASDLLVKSPADGYTLMIMQNGNTVNPALFKKLPYDTFNDFTPVAPLARAPLVIVSGAASGVKSLKELTELGKRNAAAMSFGSAEASTRLATEMLAGATRLPLNVVSYKGTGPAMTDVAGGHVNFTVTTISSTLPFKNTNKIHYVAVLAAQRSSFLPEVPTLAEQGLADIEAMGWWGIFAPAGMPPPVTQRLNAAIRAALGDAEVEKKLASFFSVEPWVGGPEELDQFVRKEVALSLKVAKQAGIQPE